MIEHAAPAPPATTTGGEGGGHSTRGVLTNPRFVALFLSQLLTQVGGNMVLFGLTVHVSDLTDSTTSVSILLLTFLVPAVAFGAIAGVFVDRYDRRKILVWTNIARGLLLILTILIQRGKGGGLIGAFGGAGGSSPFGSKAGDTFTRITLTMAGIAPDAGPTLFRAACTGSRPGHANR